MNFDESIKRLLDMAEDEYSTAPLQVDLEEFNRRVRALPRHSSERKVIAVYKLEIRKLTKAIKKCQELMVAPRLIIK